MKATHKNRVINDPKADPAYKAAILTQLDKDGALGTAHPPKRSVDGHRRQAEALCERRPQNNFDPSKGVSYTHTVLEGSPKIDAESLYHFGNVIETETKVYDFQGIPIQFKIDYGTTFNSGSLGALFHGQGKANLVSPGMFELPTMRSMRITADPGIDKFMMNDDVDRYTKFCFGNLMHQIADEYLQSRNRHLNTLVCSSPEFLALVDERPYL